MFFPRQTRQLDPVRHPYSYTILTIAIPSPSLPRRSTLDQSLLNPFHHFLILSFHPFPTQPSIHPLQSLPPLHNLPIPNSQHHHVPQLSLGIIMRQHVPIAGLVVKSFALQHLGGVEHGAGSGYADGGAGCVLPLSLP